MAFTKVNTQLLNPPTPLKHVPLRIYIPSSPPSQTSGTEGAQTGPSNANAGSFKVMQTLVAPRLANREFAPLSSLVGKYDSCFLPADSDSNLGDIGTPQTLGPVLRSLLPSLFPSSRDPVLANVILHGVPVPFTAPLEDLMREAAYPDGWLCLIVALF